MSEDFEQGRVAAIPPLVNRPAPGLLFFKGLSCAWHGSNLANLVGLIGGVFALCFFARLFLETGWSWRCPMLAAIHVPCPSCGSTRALAALSHGHLFEAWFFNPLLISAIFSAPLVFAFRSRIKAFGWIPFLALVVVNWFYLLFYLPR
jgi:hypothetical protein